MITHLQDFDLLPQQVLGLGEILFRDGFDGYHFSRALKKMRKHSWLEQLGPKKEGSRFGSDGAENWQKREWGPWCESFSFLAPEKTLAEFETSVDIQAPSGLLQHSRPCLKLEQFRKSSVFLRMNTAAALHQQ